MQLPFHNIPAARPTLSLLLTGALASLLALQGCNTREAADTVALFENAVTEKQRAREHEERRLARKKERRAATEKFGWAALKELEDYRSTHCYSGDISRLESIAAGTPVKKRHSSKLLDVSGHYGTGGGGGNGRDC